PVWRGPGRGPVLVAQRRAHPQHVALVLDRGQPRDQAAGPAPGHQRAVVADGEGDRPPVGGDEHPAPAVLAVGVEPPPRFPGGPPPEPPAPALLARGGAPPLCSAGEPPPEPPAPVRRHAPRLTATLAHEREASRIGSGAPVRDRLEWRVQLHNAHPEGWRDTAR